ncbi:MAG: hypothetical protein ACSHYA_18265, partial [Opitutaceae bacterium]
ILKSNQLSSLVKEEWSACPTEVVRQCQRVAQLPPACAEPVEGAAHPSLESVAISSRRHVRIR